MIWITQQAIGLLYGIAFTIKVSNMENHHEPIISREDFEAAGQMLRKHTKECGEG